jgi:hypothetical protein
MKIAGLKEQIGSLSAGSAIWTLIVAAAPVAGGAPLAQFS